MYRTKKLRKKNTDVQNVFVCLIPLYEQRRRESNDERKVLRKMYGLVPSNNEQK
jgi:hypothetical protein